MNQLFNRNLSIELAPLCIFFAQIGGILICIVLLVWALHRNFGVWRRFAFCFSWIFLFFYLLPSILYGGHLYSGLPSWGFLFLATNFLSLGLALWVFMSSSRLKRQPLIHLENNIFLGGWQKTLLGALFLVTLSGFFYSVPWPCTGLWALIFDPDSVLLAREMSMKLNGSPWASRMYGFYVSVLGPLLCFIGIYGVGYFFRIGKYIQVFLSVIVLCVAMFLLLIGGVKGVLLGAGIFVACAILSLPISISRRIFASTICLFFFAGVVLLFGLIRDQNQKEGRDMHYDLVGCTQHFGAHEHVLRLLRTAAMREEGGLGLPVEQLERLTQQLDGSDQTTRTKVPRLVATPEVHRPDVSGDSPFRWVQPLWNRLFIVPMQVASWHFIYVEEALSHGWLVIPVVNRLIGDGSNLAELVYGKYGVLYSSGDVTSTSTAPTTFIYSYSAHLGWFGITLAIGLLIALDVLSVILLRTSNSVLLASVTGFFAALGISLASSDFFTVMFSHGGLLGLCMFWLLKKIETKIPVGN